MSEIAIRARDLGKRYRIGQYTGGYRTLRDSIAGFAGSSLHRQEAKGSTDGNSDAENESYIWALRHIDFEVQKGQVLGIIGRNGAGKSTLLKLLSRVTEPTEGVGEIYGRVGSLLEVGTGFHPELTGRENIYLNGAILGMRRLEIDSKFDEIVSFAEVEKFIDTPVKRYSSGMYLRLAFAVAAHLEPEILVVDEVLAVGDAEFQRKCLGKMSDVAQEGRTVLFVSHNMSAILRLTEETIILDQGSLVLRAPTPEAVDVYMTTGLAMVGERRWIEDEIPQNAHPFRPLALRVMDASGKPVDRVGSTEAIRIEFEYELLEDISGIRVGFYLSSSRGEPIFTTFDTDETQVFEELTVRREGRYISRCTIPANWMNEGRYVVGTNASVYRIRSYFTDEHALTFSVDGTGAPGSHWAESRRGPFRPALAWEIQRKDT